MSGRRGTLLGAPTRSGGRISAKRKQSGQIRQAKKAQWEVEALPGSLALLDRKGNDDCEFKAVGAQLVPLHCKSDKEIKEMEMCQRIASSQK